MNALFAQPVGRDAARVDPRPLGRRWLTLPLAAYVLTTILSSMVVGFLFASVGTAIQSELGRSQVPWILVAGGSLVVAATLLELAGKVYPLPELRRQVPRIWLSWSHPTYWAAAFGLELGAGVFTYLYHADGYAYLAVLLIAPARSVGLAMGFLYGAAWSSVAVVAALQKDSGAGYAERFRGIHTRHALAAAAVFTYAAEVLLVHS